MKRIFALVTLFSSPSLVFGGNQGAMKWRPLSDAAWNEASEQARPVLIDVWAEWCKPCKQMDREVWTDSRVIEAAKSFVQISIEISRRDFAQLGPITLGKYGIHVLTAVPTVMIVDPWGETVAVREGFLHPTEVATMLKQIPPDYGAVRVYREALIKDRDNSRALAGVGLLYQRNSAHGIANRYYREALSSSGAREDERQREQLMFGIALNEVRLGDWRVARKHLEEFRVVFPGSKLLDQVLFSLVVTDVRQNKMKDAQKHATELRSAFPNSESSSAADRVLEGNRPERH